MPADDDDDVMYRDLHRSTTQRYFPDTYLDSPILEHKRTKWVAALASPEQQKSRPNQFERTVTEVKGLGVTLQKYQCVDPDLYPQHYRYDWPTTLSTEWNESCSIASDIYGSVRTAMSNHTGIGLPALPSLADPEISYWLSRWSYFDSLVEEFSRQSAQTGSNVIIIRLGKHTKVIATKDIWFLECDNIGSFLYTYEQILMLKDLMYSRAQCHVAASVFYPNAEEMSSLVAATCVWHEKCLARYGNRGFEILKNTEALSKAYLSEMTDRTFGTDGPYPRMLEKIRKKEGPGYSSYLVDDFDLVLRTVTRIEYVVELFGLLKISGHPLIDPRNGGLSAAAEARAPDETHWNDAQEICWEFNRNMLMSYIKRHGSWPNLEFSPKGKKTKLYRKCQRQYRGLNRRSYPLSDWQHCRFGKIVEFDYAPNYLDFLDDKSISLYRQNVAAFWDKDIPEKSHRRLLLELIERETLNVHDIVTLVMRREIPMDWLIVSVHPKEREFKLAPRMFSMLVLEIRIFFALTEANIADKIFPYLPQQTMTLDKNAIARKFLEITRPLSNSDALRLFIEVDLSRWNLRWRASAVDPVGRSLNDMFGVVGVFDYCHTFFASCMICVRVGDLRPEGIERPHPPESDLLWYNHLGGFEGICQKLWTICTYSMISLAINDLPLGFTLIGQADNQVLSLVTARKSNKTAEEILVALRDQVVHRVSSQCARVNQEVKEEECLESRTVITYSKAVYVEGVYYPTTLKFHSRLFPHSAQIFPSVRTNLGAIFSTSVAGAENSTQPLLSYYLACLYGAFYLTRTSMGRGPFGKQLNYYRTRLGPQMRDFLIFMLTLPSEAGGFPTVPFVGFTYKGGSDPLGKSLSAMHVLGMKSDSRLFNRMLSQMSQDNLYNPSPDVKTLFMDPFSIPIQKPVTSTDGVATETLNALRPQIKTRDLSELMSADTASYLDKLVGAFSECRPMNPLIIRDILDCSVAGVTDTIGKMFVATRTLQHVVRAMGVPIIDKVLHLESCGLLHMLQRYRSLPNDPAPTKTIFKLTQDCRARWYPGQDCPIVGLTTYQPFDFPVRVGSSGLASEGVNAVLVADSDPLTTRGPYDPYTGSKTREKRSEHGFKIVGTDSASRAMRKLQLIGSQTGSDTVFKTMLDVVGWSRTNTQLSQHSNVLTGTSGGTLSHRYAARAGHQEAHNVGSPNFATHCVVSSDNVGVLAGGIYDYPVMFQEIILYALWLLLMTYLDSNIKYAAVTVVTEGTEMEPLPNVDIMGPEQVTLPVLRYATNPLVFIPDLKLEHISGALVHPALPITENFEPSMELRRMVVEAFFRTLLRKHSMGRQIGDGAKQHFQGHTMDIAEVRSNTLWLIAECIKNVVVDEAVSNYMMTDLNQLSRWVIMTFASKLISPLASSVTASIGHPLLSFDPMVIRFGLFDQPSYGGSSYSSHERFCAVIQRMVFRALSGTDVKYNHRKIGIFTSENNRVLSETLTQCFLCDMYVWIKKGVLSKAELTIAIGSNLLPALRKQHEETDRVSMIVRAALNLARMLDPHDPGAAEIARRFGRSRVIGYKTTVLDMMKATRDTDKWGLIRYPEVPRRILKSNSSLLPDSDTWCPEPSGPVLSGSRALDASMSTPDNILTEVYYRNLGRVGYYSGTAIFTWSIFGPLLAQYPLIIIGSGMGAAARVALDNGCAHVFGIDLRSSLPMKSHRFRSYKPPLVMGSEYAEVYTQMPESYTTTGDWSDSEIRRLILKYDAGGYTLLIDIQDASHRFGLEVLEDVLMLKRAGVVILRTYLSQTEHRAMCCDLSASGITFKSYTLEASGSVYPVVFVLTDWSSSPVTCLEVKGKLERRPIQIPFNEEPDNFEVAVARADAILNMYMPPTTQNWDDIRVQMAHLIEETHGDYDSRFSYGHWTKLLRAYLSAVFACLPEESRMERLLLWYFSGYADIDVEGMDGKLRVIVDWGVCHHLASTVARVCS